jgi:hypothetical protein
MPIAPADLFARVGLTIKSAVPWGQKVPCDGPGVYAVCLSGDASRNSPVSPQAPLSLDRVREWIEYVPTFTLDGKAGPSAVAVARCLQTFWLPDETILYVGKATCLRARLDQFRRHRLGDRKPHAGGHWLKTLAVLPYLHVFFCECESVGQAEAKEHEALGVFVGQVSAAARARLHNPELPIPFANREYPRGTGKQRRIRGDVHR